MWVALVVGCPCSEDFSPSTETKISKFQFDDFDSTFNSCCGTQDDVLRGIGAREPLQCRPLRQATDEVVKAH